MSIWQDLENIEEGTEEYQDIFNELVAEELYFQLQDDEFLIVPKGYYEEYECLIDTRIGEIKSIPKDFDEICDSTFVYYNGSNKGRKVLLEAGLIEKDMFDDYGYSLKGTKQWKLIKIIHSWDVYIVEILCLNLMPKLLKSLAIRC